MEDKPLTKYCHFIACCLIYSVPAQRVKCTLSSKNPVCIQGVPGGMDKTSGECSLC